MQPLVKPGAAIILPVYEPKGNWEENFYRNAVMLNALLSATIQLTYVIVYDGTPAAAQLAAFKRLASSIHNISFLYYEKNMGKGYAMRYGVKNVSADFYLTIDFDFPYTQESIRKMVHTLMLGKDLVIGKRSDKYYSQVPLKRKVISKTLAIMNGLFLGLPLNDTQSGIKGFNNNGKKQFLKTTINRFLVDTEFVLRSSNEKLDIETISIELNEGLSFTNFGFKTLKTEFLNFCKLVFLNSSLQLKKLNV